MSQLSWPGVEHALAKAAELLVAAEQRGGSYPSDESRSLQYIADSWRSLAEVAHALGRDDPAPEPEKHTPKDDREVFVPSGGPVKPGPYLVGEEGCGFTVPAATASSSSTSATGGNVTVTVDLTDGGGVNETVARLLRKEVRTRAAAKADEELLRRLRRIVRNAGGLGKAFGDRS